MKFSIAKLLYAVALLAIGFAVFQSEKAGQRKAMLTSIDFSPDGRQLAVCLHQYNGLNRKFHTRFDRTISILEYPSLNTKQIVLQDQQIRSLELPPVSEDLKVVLNEEGLDTFFWNSQTRVLHTDHHLFYLDSHCQKILACDLTTGAKKATAVFDFGKVLSFDVSADGRQVLFQGLAPSRDMNRSKSGYTFSVGEDEYLLPDESEPGEPAILLTPDVMHAFPYHDVLSIEADQPVKIGDDFNGTADRSVKSNVGDDSEVFQVVQDNDSFNDLSEFWNHRMTSRPMEWRLAFLPTADKPPGVAVIATNDMARLKLVSKKKDPANWRKEVIPNWFSSIVDYDVSAGDCQCGRLLKNGKVMLSFADESSESQSQDVLFGCQSDTESRICLSDNGKYLAITHKNSVEIFRIDNLLNETQPGMIGNLGPAEALRIAPPLVSRIELDRQPMSLTFSPDAQNLLIGDIDGFVSSYDYVSGHLNSEVKVPQKPRGLKREYAITALVIWLFIGLLAGIKSRINSLPRKQTLQ